MIIATRTEWDGSEAYGYIETDNGGDQSYGPFKTVADAKSNLISNIEEAFDETFDPARHTEVTLPEDGDEEESCA